MESQAEYFDKALNSPFVIGAFGALITSVCFIPGKTRIEKTFNVFCGALVSNYLAPPLIGAFGLAPVTYLGGASFLLGILGMAVLAAFFQGVRDTNVRELLTSWLRRPGSPKE